MFRSAKITTMSGFSYTTDINGTVDSIVSYFLGKKFNIGIYPIEKIEIVVKVEVFCPLYGSLEGESSLMPMTEN
jgi:hypothetical protein